MGHVQFVADEIGEMPLAPVAVFSPRERPPALYYLMRLRLGVTSSTLPGR